MIVQNVRVEKTEKDGKDRAASSDKTIDNAQMLFEVESKNSERGIVC